MNKKLNIFVALFSFCFILTSCLPKNTQEAGTDSGLSSLTLKTPEPLKQKSSFVKMVASSEKEDCNVVYPEGTSSDTNDMSKSASISDSNSTISLTFMNKCFPYEITLSYSCKDDKTKVCYKGTATADLANRDESGRIALSLSVKSVSESSGDTTDVDIDVSFADDTKDSSKETYTDNNSAKEEPSVSDSTRSSSSSSDKKFSSGITHIKINATVVK